MSSSASRDGRRMSVTRECHRRLSRQSSTRESCHCRKGTRLSRKATGPETAKLKRIYATVPESNERYIPVPKSYRKALKKTNCNHRCTALLKGLRSRVPFIDSIRNYNVRENLLADLIAGLGTTGLHFPQALAYGILAGLTPAIGMVSTIFPVFIYMFFGAATHTSIGTNSIVCIMLGDLLLDPSVNEYISTVVGEAANINSELVNSSLVENMTASSVSDYSEILEDKIMAVKISLVAGVTLYTGIIFTVLAVFRMGFLVTYLSQAFMSGFTTGVALHIFSSQVKTALGVSIRPVGGIGKLIKLYREIILNITSSNISAILVTVVCVAILMLVKILINERKKLKIPVPIDAILLVVATLISSLANLPERIHVDSLGKVQLGVPAPSVPQLTPATPLIISAVQIALVTFFLNLSVMKIIARKNGYEINENVEVSAYAICNLIPAFFSNMPASINPPRGSLLSSMGAKTTFNGVSTVAIMLALTFYFGQFFESCPRAVLASMIMVATKDLLMQVMVLPKLWRVNKNDFTTWIIAALACILIDIPYGLVLGVLASLISVVNQSQRGWVSVLGKSDLEDLYLDADEFGSMREIPRIKIVRMESSLYFATAEKFRKSIYKIIEEDADRQKPLDQEMASLNEDSMCLGSVQSVISEPILESDNEHETKSSIQATENTDTDEHHYKSVLVIDCIPINFIDGTGLDMLKLVTFELSSIDVIVYLARCSRYMISLLEKSDFYETFPRDHVFVDIPDAVNAGRIALRHGRSAMRPAFNASGIREQDHANRDEDAKEDIKKKRRTLLSMPSFREEDDEVPYEHFLERHGSIFQHV